MAGEGVLSTSGLGEGLSSGAGSGEGVRICRWWAGDGSLIGSGEDCSAGSGVASLSASGLHTRPESSAKATTHKTVKTLPEKRPER